MTKLNEFNGWRAAGSEGQHHRWQSQRKKKNTQCSVGPHAMRTNVKHTFQRKKSRADIQKNRDDREKSPLNDKRHIIGVQFHSPQKDFSQLCTQFQKICLDEWQTRICHDRFRSFRKFHIATINRQVWNDDEIQKKFIRLDDDRWKFVIKRRRADPTKDRTSHVDDGQSQKTAIFEYRSDDQPRYCFKIFLITASQSIHRLNEEAV